MHTFPRESCNSSAWQATYPCIVIHIRGALQLAANRSLMLNQQPKKLTTEALFMILVLLAFVVLSLISSALNVYEYFLNSPKKKDVTGNVRKEFIANEISCKGVEKKSNENSVWVKRCKLLLSFFNVRDNGRQLLQSTSEANQLSCLDGIRSIAIFFIILGHIFTLYPNVMRNTDKYLVKYLKSSLLGMRVMAVDAFLILSGLVNGYTVSCQYHGNEGKISWLLILLRRFFKLTPASLIVIGFHSTLFSYLGSGPVWPNYETNPVCKENWIWNLLYLNNFLSHAQQCVAHFWFLACLMQLHAISPVFLMLIFRKPKLGYSLTVLAIIFSYITSSLLIKMHGLDVLIEELVKNSSDIVAAVTKFWPYFNLVYVKPYSRLGAYLSGIALGCYIENRNISNSVKYRLVISSLGWVIPIILLCLYSFVPLYTIFPFFNCCLCLIILTCVMRQNGFLNKFLSNKVFTILSRLSFCTYLTHMLVLEKFFLSFEDLMEESYLTLVLIPTYLYLWTFAVSFIFTLVFAMPVSKMYASFKEHFPKKRSQKTN